MVVDGPPLLDLVGAMSWMDAAQLSDMNLQSRLFSTAIWQTMKETTLLMKVEQRMREGNVFILSVTESDRASFCL